MGEAWNEELMYEVSLFFNLFMVQKMKTELKRSEGIINFSIH